MNVQAIDPPESDIHPEHRVLNVAAYKFLPLQDLESLRESLSARCEELELKGTILLSPEGLNMFLAGEVEAIDSFLGELTERPGLQDLEVKRSYSERVPFRRMLVRLKKEIIPCGMETIKPAETTSPKISASELHRWLEEGKPVRLLDVRNDYEIELGTFRGAEHLNLQHFRDFPEAIDQLPDSAKQDPVVMFCTGGIRCEKAGPVMERAGFQEIYQLDGGILKYFEDCGGDHYDGSCFVFDGRVALDPELKPTGNLLCFNCQAVLTADDVSSGKFMFGQYCPRCYVDPEVLNARTQAERQSAIRELAASQPGSSPYTNKRNIHTPRRFAGLSLIDFLCAYQPRIEREQWLEWIQLEQITCEGMACEADMTVREGQKFVQLMPNTMEPEINPDISIVFEDEWIVAFNKPAPLPCHPSGRFNRNSLSELIADAYPNEKLRLVHRIDANTSGLVLASRKYRDAKVLQQQFAEQTVHKTYLARVCGHVADNAASGASSEAEFTCEEPISERSCNEVGARAVERMGLEARTHFRVLKEFADNTSLVEARPVTGRTHQIRVHLWHLGHPVCGDPIYLPGGKFGDTATLEVTLPPMLLCSQRLEFEHPFLGERMTIEVPQPDWTID